MTRNEDRSFGLTVGGAFVVLAGVLAWRTHLRAATVVALLGAVLMAAGLVVPVALGPVRKAWMAGAHRISRVTTPVFLGIVYFLVVTPTGLIMRAAGRNPLKSPPPAESCWMPRESRGGERLRMTRQF